MRPVPNTVLSFLDVEAREEKDSDEEEEEEGDLDDFIVNQDFNSEEGPNLEGGMWHLKWNGPPGGEDEFSALLDRILDRSTDPRNRALARGGDPAPFNIGIKMPPTKDDYPLWRLRCRLGVEEEAVFFLLQNAEPRHELRSAFTQGSVRGWVYLEATMNSHLSHLLTRTPGLFRTLQTGVVRQQIDFEDWTKTLMMRDPTLALDVGQWVRVCKGSYKGDVGVVERLEDWGGVRLLLVPRQRPPRSNTTLKRKHSQPRPEPALFDPIAASRIFQIDPSKQGDEVYLFRGDSFDHGLILLPFDSHSLSSTFVRISSSVFFAFQQSLHPLVLSSSPPCPSDWNFSIRERVLIPSSGKRGIILTTHEASVEVDLSFGEGIINVPWFDLRKEVNAADFVEIEGGPYRGQAGWVSAVDGPVAHIVEQVELERLQAGCDPALLKKFEAHVNHLNVTGAPVTYKHNTPSSSKTLLQRDEVPWIGTQVLITGTKNPMKGYRGVVKDVLPGQTERSELRVAVQFVHLDPAAPFKTVIVDLKDVVDANLKCPLSNLPAPQEGVPISQPPDDSPPLWAGSGTPMPDWSPSSTPAWNPSAISPAVPFSFRSQPLPGPSCPSPPLHSETEHPLLDSRLLGIQLKVSANGGKYAQKEVVVSSALVDGHVSIRRNHYNSSEALSPEWVSPKNPHPTHDNGLLVVIKGDHCGKYVRRIHHRHEGDTSTIILAVVTRAEGVADNLTGETLELEPKDLCVVSETKEDKRRNESLMTDLRKQARRKR